MMWELRLATPLATRLAHLTRSQGRSMRRAHKDMTREPPCTTRALCPW